MPRVADTLDVFSFLRLLQAKGGIVGNDSGAERIPTVCKTHRSNYRAVPITWLYGERSNHVVRLTNKEREGVRRAYKDDFVFGSPFSARSTRPFPPSTEEEREEYWTSLGRS